jgi:hypothetical protein
MKYSKIWPSNMCHYLMPNGVGDCIIKIFNDNKNVMHKNDVKIKSSKIGYESFKYKRKSKWMGTNINSF